MKKAILIDVENRDIREVQIKGDLKSMYELIKCDVVTCVTIHEDNDVYVDDEGLLKLTPNSMFFLHESYPQPIAGNGLILGLNHEDGDSISTTLQIDDVREKVTFLTLDEVRKGNY